jgi:exopolysaccharide biosynthesis WecB/TagA/CpsF family protein
LKTKDNILERLTIIKNSHLEQKLEGFLKLKGTNTIGFLNQHAYNLILGNMDVYCDFCDIDYLLRDGKGIELACKYHKIDPGLNLNGTDFIPILIKKIINSSLPVKFFSYGTSTPWLERGNEKLFQQNSVLSLDGFLTLQEYIAHFTKHHDEATLNVIVLAMGMPKQEQVAKHIKQEGKSRTIIICGGAILDFQAGRLKRAPKVMRSIGLEWLYRLVCEPKRLFKRYVIGIPLFFVNVLNSTKKNS